jgi:hypothetical protein
MSDESRNNLPVDKEAEAENADGLPASRTGKVADATSPQFSSQAFGREVGFLARIERLVCLRADEARAKAAHLADSQNELIQLAGAVRDLSKTAAGITRRTQFLSMATGDNLRPAAAAVILLAKILRHVSDLSCITKDAVEAQGATMRHLTKIVGEAAQVSTYLTGKVVALAEEARTILPPLSRNNLVEAELQCLDGELQKVIAGLRGPEASTETSSDEVTL